MQLQSGAKKRKLAREALTGFGSEAIDMKMAMGMAMDMGLTGEEEGEEMQNMSDEQMVSLFLGSCRALLIQDSSNLLQSTVIFPTYRWPLSSTTFHSPLPLLKNLSSTPTTSLPRQITPFPAQTWTNTPLPLSAMPFSLLTSLVMADKKVKVEVSMAMVKEVKKVRWTRISRCLIYQI